MERIRNGTYKIRNSKNTIDITDKMQPVYLDKIIINMYSSGYYILTTKLNPKLEIKVPHDFLVECEYKKSWQSIRKERNIPCNIEKHFGLINVPKDANYNLDVKSYCKTMCGSGCPALLQNTYDDNYTCHFKNIKKSKYDEISEFSQNDG